MERAGLILASILFATSASASWVQDWYSAPQQQQERAVEREQRSQQIEHQRCIDKLKQYRKALEQHPDSSYYKWKLNTWEKRCGRK